MKTVNLFLAAVFFLYSSCYAAAGGAPGAVKANRDPYAWDFGRVKEGEVLKYQFILKNDTQKVLNIKDVTTSCGCTASQIQKKTLQPREATVVEVSFNSKGYSGPIQQFVYVNTDNLDNPVIKFIIKAEVVK